MHNGCVDTDPAAKSFGEATAGITSVLKRLPHHFKEQPLLWIHPRCIDRRDTEQ